ncbi:hypothetical protein CPB83DRAFT_888476 [Crepidotus variabilis]|uniref:Uncharacterized protein n=1 Tax=Crepidotus variabilis TaxID=179855 RepID=A0A9P6EUZ5_9AGAR|nr:hypothetical protein CPB83DRAFT_888476 [Crepidotus variabilis]
MGINKDTLIIIIIFGCIGVITLLFLILRLIRHSTSTSNPLPPPQPLAHHREQELAKFRDSVLPRSQTWYQAGQFSPNTIASSGSALGSRASLLAKASPSLSADSQESPTLELNHTLPLPNPSFHSRPGSSHSFASSSDLTLPPSPTPTRGSTPPLTSEISVSPRSRVPSASPSHLSGPLSVSSSYSTLHSKASRRNTLRGSPHSRHSQIQIVLPAPLGIDPNAPLSAPPSSLRRPLSGMNLGEAYDRRSIADKWVSSPSLAPEFHDSPPPVPALPPITTSSLAPQQRAASTPTLPTIRSTISDTSADPVPSIPPVPRVPSMYNTSSEHGDVTRPPGLNADAYSNDSSIMNA